MRVAVTGGRGQLGRQLERVFSGNDVLIVDLPDLDIRSTRIIEDIKRFEPELIVHAAAMTDVDGCARDPDEAMRSNAFGTRNVALAARQTNADLVYISTNEVFPGEAGHIYDEFDTVGPINPYGRSKAAGEQYVRTLWPRHFICRTAWVYGPGGNHFVGKILDRAAQGDLTVVDDEIGSPTYAPDLAEAIRDIASSGVYGTYHLVNEGVCSRYEFAAAIVELSGLPNRIHASKLAKWPRPSRVPPHTPLRNFAAAELGITLPPWRESLKRYLASLSR
jgi:dTDP-4-dehydrorhamnose reductase